MPLRVRPKTFSDWVNHLQYYSSIILLTVVVMVDKTRESNDQMNVLKTYLGVSDSPDESYPRARGSCQWIDDREDFQEWRDSAAAYLKDDAPTPPKDPSILWISANPGTGKTFLAAHVVDELAQFQLECACYYFHAGNKTTQTLGNFVRSIAYQMAASNASVREKLVALYEEGFTFDKDDAATIWTKLFKRGILQVSTIRLVRISKCLHRGSEGSNTDTSILGHRRGGRMQQVPRALYHDQGYSTFLSAADPDHQ